MKYSYRAASTLNGKIQAGVVEALNEEEVIQHLREINCYPIEISAQKIVELKREKLSLSPKQLFRLDRISKKEVLTFTRDMSTLISSGVSIDRSLAIIIRQTKSEKFSKIVGDIQESVQKGSSLEEALSKHRKIFPELYTNMIRAGEASGNIDEILLKISQFLEDEDELINTVKSAMTYPLLMTFVGGGAIAVLLLFVVPRFSEILKGLGQTLPLPTVILLSISYFLVHFWWVILGFIFILFAIYRYYYNSPEGKLVIDTFKLNVPLFGDLIRKAATARFTKILGVLISSGVPILQSMDIVTGVIGNKAISKVIERTQESIKEGENISFPLERSGIFPHLVINLINIGEETGRLDEMLLKVATIYEQEVKRTTKMLTSLIEPLLILFMGVVVGFVVISMLLAIFSVNIVTL